MKSIKRERGVSLVEFAIVFPFAMLFVLSLIQLGLIYMGKLTLNHATFMAARHGAVKNASESEIMDSVQRGLIPFYQNSTTGNAASRLLVALAFAKADPLARLKVERLSPNAKTFTDFGVTINGQKQIPNDNLAYRNSTVRTNSGVNIQDANLLKIKVTYGYELKVPLMRKVLSTVMCGGFSPIEAFGGDVPIYKAVMPASTDCIYYLTGRIPMVSYAVVQMQSPAYP